MKHLRSRWRIVFSSLLGSLVFLPAPSHAQTTVTTPIIVPLYFTPTDTGAAKLGIYASIGTGGTPKLFEFDTGGTGFYAAYSSNAGVAPWWGSGVTLGGPPIANTYDSGLSYAGFVAQGAVSIFSSANATTPSVVTASTTQIGQMDSIEKINPDDPDASPQILWTNAGEFQPCVPPINGAFYGDFGMNLAYNTNNSSSGLTNLIAQLNFAPSVIPGFRIHANFLTQNASLQIGLTSLDTNSPTANYFHMNLDSAGGNATTPVSNLPFYSQQLFNADIQIQGDGPEVLQSINVGMTPDTGANTTLHNTQLSPQPLPGEYDHFIDWKNDDENVGDLKNNLQFTLTGNTTSGDLFQILNFQTNDVINFGNVAVQNNRPLNSNYYLNTGISLFYQYDVIYNIQEGIIGLDTVPEPSGGAFLALALSLSYLLRHRRRQRSDGYTL